MPEISIVVPVYKTEAYLPRCIESILAQSFRDYELLLVDDGSPDGCPEICDQYAQKDSRIRVIHQKNSGVSAARNAGIDSAAARYLMFCDSDDYVAPNWCEELYQAIQGREDHWIVSDLYRVEDENLIPPPRKDYRIMTI